MTWNEICCSFPDEWVVVANYERSGPVNVDGTLLAHAPDRADIQEAVSNAIKEFGKAAVRYTGELVHSSDIPLLWQISHTS